MSHPQDDSGDSVDSLSSTLEQSSFEPHQQHMMGSGGLSDPIILQLLANRPRMTDVSDADEEERKRRMCEYLA